MAKSKTQTQEQKYYPVSYIEPGFASKENLQSFFKFASNWKGNNAITTLISCKITQNELIVLDNPELPVE